MEMLGFSGGTQLKFPLPREKFLSSSFFGKAVAAQTGRVSNVTLGKFDRTTSCVLSERQPLNSVLADVTQDLVVSPGTLHQHIYVLSEIWPLKLISIWCIWYFALAYSPLVHSVIRSDFSQFWVGFYFLLIIIEWYWTFNAIPSILTGGILCRKFKMEYFQTAKPTPRPLFLSY